MTPQEMLQEISRSWFLSEPALYALYCLQQLTEEPRMDCPLRCGEGRLEYNPLLLSHHNYRQVEQLMRIEMVRLFLKHPYDRRPTGCSGQVIALGSDCTIADGYCFLNPDGQPILKGPNAYNLPLGQCYEWYCKALQNNQERNDSSNSPNSPNTPNSPNSPDSPNPPNSSNSPNSSNDSSSLWHADTLMQQRINDLIHRTNDWGSLPGEIVERIKASTRARIDMSLVMQGFQSAILSSRRQLTRMRPNRRTGFLQMGSIRQFDTRLLVAVDVSGSISDITLQDFFSVVLRIFRYGITQIDVVQFDAEMGEIHPLLSARPDIEVHGRGGTSFQPLFDYFFSPKQAHNYDGLIILTDGDAPPPVYPSRNHQDEGAKSSLPCGNGGDEGERASLPWGDRGDGGERASLPWGDRGGLLWVCKDQVSYQAHHRWMQRFGRVCWVQ